MLGFQLNVSASAKAEVLIISVHNRVPKPLLCVASKTSNADASQITAKKTRTS